MFLYSSFVISIHLMFDLCLWPYQFFFLFFTFFLTFFKLWLFVSNQFVLYCIIGATRFRRSILTAKLYMYPICVTLANIVRKQLWILDIRYKTTVYLVWRGTKKGVIRSWENGDLDEVGVNFLSLSTLHLFLAYLHPFCTCTCTSFKTAFVIVIN